MTGRAPSAARRGRPVPATEEIQEPSDELRRDRSNIPRRAWARGPAGPAEPAGAEIEWTEAERFPYFAGTRPTPQAVADGLLAPLGRDWAGFSAEADRFVAEGENVVAFGAYAGTCKATGRVLTARFAHLWTVRAGKIVGFVQHTDTAKVLEAMRG